MVLVVLDTHLSLLTKPGKAEMPKGVKYNPMLVWRLVCFYPSKRNNVES